MSENKNPNWGRPPQPSNTGYQKPNWGGAPQWSTTGSQTPHWGGAPQWSTTGALANPVGSTVPEYQTITIDGVTYNVVRVISAHSGEAKIFEIENQGNRYALKLYRPGVVPNHEVLERVMNLRGNGVLVDIYAHGEWLDEQTGVTHDYEILEYCSGGSLADLPPSHDEKRMKEYAARMATALDYAHSHGILHRDVKPANFLFTDETRTRFVLSDWGLAKILDEKGRTVTDAGRTKLYAAPEMYTYIYGKPTYVNTKADFFSMGMTLMALWMGEGVLLADETELVKNKQEETLPYPHRREIGTHLLSLIKALTRRNPDVRAGFDEVVRWVRGENIFNDSIDDGQKDFRIVLSAKDHLIAYSAEELGKMMWENKEIAKRMLYSGELSESLRRIECPELTVEMERIREILYPGNQDYGLFAACLTLNSNTIYEGVKGNRLTTPADIATELLDNSQHYCNVLCGKDNHPLWDYITANGLADSLASFKPTIRKNGEIGVRAVAYMLAPELPFKLDADRISLISGSITEFNSIGEIKQALADKSINPSIGFDQEDFLIWAAFREPELTGRAQILIENEKDASYRSALVTYALMPDVGFDYTPTTVGPKAIADVMLQKLEENDLKWFDKILAQFEVSNVKAYLTACDKYSDQISWIRYCLDYRSEDNQKKCGPYTPRIAYFKIVHGLRGGDVPPISIGKHTIKDITDLSIAGRTLTPKQQNVAADWLTLSFQENPHADYSHISYYQLTSHYFDFLRSSLPECDYLKKADAKRKKIEESRDKLTSEKKRINKYKSIILYCFLFPLLLAIVGSCVATTKIDPKEMENFLEPLTKGLAAAWVVIGILIAVMGQLYFGIFTAVLGPFIVLFIFVMMGADMGWLIIGAFILQLIFSVRMLIKWQPKKTRKISGMDLEELGRRMIIADASGSGVMTSNNGQVNGNIIEATYKANWKAAKKISSSITLHMVWLTIITIVAVVYCILLIWFKTEIVEVQ